MAVSSETAIWRSTSSLSTYLAEHRDTLLAFTSRHIRIGTVQVSSIFVYTSRSLSAEPSAGSLGFKPCRRSHLSGMPSPSVSTGGVVDFSSGQPPTWLCESMIEPFRCRTSFTIRASTESRRGNDAPTARSTESKAARGHFLSLPGEPQSLRGRSLLVACHRLSPDQKTSSCRESIDSLSSKTLSLM